jgi:hypothetical protein
MDGTFLEKVDVMQPEEAVEQRRQTINHYIDTLSEGEFDMARSIADDLMEDAEPLAETAVIIPVAAHQEAHNIAHAVSEYARQEPRSDFTVVLGLNIPMSALGTEEVADTLEEVDKAKADHPELDLRSTFVTYDDPVIGEVRRDLWNGVAIAVADGGTLDAAKEIIGINHDIDLVMLARTCIAKVQERYARRDQRHILSTISPISGTRVKHDFSHDHPNISRAVQWSDFVYRQTGEAVEAGLVIPFSNYTALGGFDRTSRTYEVAGFAEKSLVGAHVLRGTNTITSLRRYIANMQEYGYGIWSPETFTAHDECREPLDNPDITVKRQHEIVSDSLIYHSKLLMQGAADQAEKESRWQTGAKNYAEVRSRIRSQIEKTAKVSAFVLDRTVSSEKLNKRFERYFSSDYIDIFLDQYFALQKEQ